MKQLLLIFCILSLQGFAGYNPKWISIRTVDTVDVSKDVYQVCKDSSTLIKLEFQFQDVEEAEGMDIDWEIGALNGTSTALDPGPTYSQPLDMSSEPAGIYEAEATIGGKKIIIDYNKRFYVVEITFTAVNNVQTDMYKAFEVDIKPHSFPRDVDFTISRNNGTAGIAAFKTGGQTKTLTGPTVGKQYVYIKGSEVSVPADTNFPQNMHLTASIDGDDCDFEDFQIVDCASVFAGVTFNVTNGVGVSEFDSMEASYKKDGAGVIRAVVFQGIRPVKWTPTITITAPNNTKASEFEVGIVQVYAKVRNIGLYDTGSWIEEISQTPVRDAVSGAAYDADLYFAIHPDYHFKFTKTGSVAGGIANLKLGDLPSEPFYINNYEEPSFPQPKIAGKLITADIRWDFVSILVVRHKDGCLKAIKHIKWHTDWSCIIRYLPSLPGGPDGEVDVPNSQPTKDDIIIDVADGDGSEPFIESTTLANAVLAYKWH